MPPPRRPGWSAPSCELVGALASPGRALACRVRSPPPLPRRPISLPMSQVLDFDQPYDVDLILMPYRYWLSDSMVLQGELIPSSGRCLVWRRLVNAAGQLGGQGSLPQVPHAQRARRCGFNKPYESPLLHPRNHCAQISDDGCRCLRKDIELLVHRVRYMRNTQNDKS